MKRKLISLHLNKGSNSGFSLVEILVGVAILGFVVTPLLYSFVVSQRISSNSHYLGDATTASRNIIEYVKNNGMPGILEYESGDTSPFGGTITSFDKNPDDGKYVMEITGLPAGTLSNADTGAASTTTFNAVITLDTSRYKTGDPGDPSFNDHLIADYNPPDHSFMQYTDPDIDPDVLAVREKDPTDVNYYGYKQFNRTIKIDAQVDSTDNVVEFAITYEYRDPGMTAPFFEIDLDRVYDSYNISDPHPITIYLFYRPHFTDPAISAVPDKIEINNSDIEDLTVFLIKQTPMDMRPDYTPSLPVTTFIGREGSYRSFIEQIEQNSSTMYSTRSKNTTVYTNYRKNFTCEDAACIPCVHINPGNFTYLIRWGAGSPRTSWVTFNDTITGWELRTLPSIRWHFRSEMLIIKEPQDRLYDIKVEIYRQGSTRPLAEFDATHLE